MPDPRAAARLGGLRSWLGPDHAPRPARTPAGTRASKALRDISEAFDRCEISDGQTLSFHHQYRNGDHTLGLVLDEAERRNLRGLTISASSLFPVHAPLVRHLHNNVVTRIISNYIAGPVADAVMDGALAEPVILQSHGGRARALSTGALPIDVAFVAAAMVSPDGAATGRAGHAACGPLGYAMVDAAYAKRTVVLAPTCAAINHTDIPADHVDFYVPDVNAGDALGIASGTTRAMTTATAQGIAQNVACVIRASGLVRDGMVFQTGSGGYSLGTIPAIGAALRDAGAVAGAIHGGITQAHVALLQSGLARRIRDVQCFDRAAVASSMTDARHLAMSAAEYASPLHPSPAIDALDVVVLGAAEIDRDFNVNVARSGDGRLIGGPGGHPDTAAGAKMTVIVTTLTSGGWPKVVDHVGCITTPGQDVDVLVTDAGIAVSPRRADLVERLRADGIPVSKIGDLIAQASRTASHTPHQPNGAARVLIEAREGVLLDAVMAS